MATMSDVARRAGVTAATVSNVINKKGIVGEETRQRVLAIIEELGYRPNLVARGLRQKLSYTIALILPSISNPFYPEIADEIEAVAREQHYHILLCNTHFDPAIGREQLESLSTRWIDGLLIAAGSISAAEVQMMIERELPMVLCLDWQEQELVKTLPLVTVDFFRAGELAAQYLLELGHRHLAVIVEPPSHLIRMEGFCQVLAQAGMPLSQEQICRTDPTEGSAYRAAQALLQRPVRPTAVFTTNDEMALQVMTAAADVGLRIPEDLSLIGLDDISLATRLRPRLTTIALPKRALAKTATQLLLRLIGKEEIAFTEAHITLLPQLVVRDSAAPPRTL